MSDIGLILILAVLILGGLIATVGDRIGTKVGKARLSLFNLRPKRTATIVTILTGTLISASTFGILFASSRQFREMLLGFNSLQNKLRDQNRELRQSSEELQTTNQQKRQVEDELERTRAERKQAEGQLNRINESLKQALVKQNQTNEQLKTAEAQRDLIRGQLDTVSQQAETLRSEINQLQSEQETLIAQRDAVKAQIAERDQQIAERTEIIQRRDREISNRDQVIAQREVQLKQLEAQQALLAEAVQQSEQEAQLIRGGYLAILRSQVLSSGVLRVVDPNAAKAAVDRLLKEANRTAWQLVQPGSPDVAQIVQIKTAEVERLITTINDGQDYVVRIVADANYVRGERRPISVYATAIPNRVVFLAGEIVASKTLEPAKLTPDQFQQGIEQLIAFSNFRAKRAGVINDGIQLEKLESLASFLDQLRQYQTPVELRAVASDVTYTVGPLRIELVVVQNGQVVLRMS
ncbi:DUF3084 domain-containing protein [Myxacorys almedinensis]|uniref:DUF3084 domain-containing protein n=1 Tax=Myxacorys almedinensis A TaxID=2690445 RepID=A0A8J8CKQ6_9CYAN|nr:DUF3084 domain-containing protein [Myxacorys almedinensis]NDJ18861.1 DUF3084 domain-containing protein [Myxacorys almedinensis A]